MFTSRFVSLSTLVILAACTSATTNPAPAPAASNNPAVCPAKDASVLAKAPTVHEGDIRGSETWTAEASPHLVRGDVSIRDGAKLTIAPCAVVQLVEAASLQVAYPFTPNQGELLAEGTADAPIRFLPKDGARWNNVFVHAPGKARFAYTTFEGGGGGEDETGHATILARGDGGLPRKGIVSVDHVTIKGSRGAGIKLDGGASFADGSKELVITGSGVGNAFHPYPLEAGEQAIDGLPTGTYTGNAKDPHYAVLTIEAGVKMLFEKDTVFQVESDANGASAVRALGTADKPVVFTAALAPKPGDWRGFYFNGPNSAKNALQHIRLEYTGADCHCSLVTCSAGVETYHGALLFSEEPKAMFLEGSVVAHGAAHGIVQGYRGLSFDWKQGNTYEDVAGCAVTEPVNPDTSCPDPRPACK